VRRVVPIIILVALATTALVAQRRGGRYREPPVTQIDRGGVPMWDINKQFSKDVFTFVRVKYTSSGYGGWGGAGVWHVDYPDAELNLSYRLQQLTAMKVNPEGKVLEITDRELFHYPFIYIVEPGELLFSDEEVTTLRRYLLSGGFLMVDDFWGEAQWRNLYQQMKRVFPEREPEELDLTHEIFNCVFKLNEKPQIPNVGRGTYSQYDGVTWETYDSKEPHYKAFFDDKRRMMVMICHNTDLGDGWEREGENEYYFREFSEKKAYPLGINIIFYAMTH
jgi:hypothetical protein